MKKTLKSLEAELNRMEKVNQELGNIIKQKDIEIDKMKLSMNFYRAIDQHFHLLLTGVVSGMKEGTFPRRPA